MAKKQTKKTAAIKFDTDWKYAPSPESQDHIRLEEKYDLFIDGKFTPPSSGKYFETINPANENTMSKNLMRNLFILPLNHIINRSLFNPFNPSADIIYQTFIHISGFFIFCRKTFSLSGD